MKISRTQNAFRNLIFGIILKLYQIVIPFLLRTAMTYFIGIQYLGLNGLFTSLLQVLNLAELGVGNAMIYSMYKPIAEDDHDRICALMKLYRLYYRIIGCIIAIIGCILIPFIPSLIKGDVPENINIYVLYILNLSATVLSYWLFAYKGAIIQAHQRTDIISKVTLITNTLQYVFQFLVLWLFKNYYLFIIVVLFTQMITNISSAIAAQKMYPQYNPRGVLDKSVKSDINKKIRDLFTSKIGAVVLNSADTIVISSFLGLTVLAIYQNYYYILTAVISLVAIAFTSCTAGVGNSLIVETKEKNYNDLNKFTFLISWIAGVCLCCFLGIFQPFMEIWMGKENMLPYSAVICLGVYYYIYEINSLLNMYKDAGGIWHQDRWRPLLTSLLNLVLNLIMVQFWGIYGVLLSTVLATVMLGMPWLMHSLFSTLFNKENLYDYLRKLLLYLFVSAGSCTISVFLCSLVQGSSALLRLIICAVICIMIPNIIFFFVYRKKKEFNECLILINGLTKNKLSRILNRMSTIEKK